ncbi:hypothetical protein ABZU76_51325 [Amycolatopsis sp. NPDC005232]|uniref:hypothetical protein n=1 Tax=Amycolatopsis sp. NPDC005232 TaxID=3157027 RepID=UPI0033AA98CF
MSTNAVETAVTREQCRTAKVKLQLIERPVAAAIRIRSSSVKDPFVQHQLSAQARYVANPDLTVADTRRLNGVGAAVDEFLDKVGAREPK